MESARQITGFAGLVIVFALLGISFYPQHEAMHCLWNWTIQGAEGDCVVVYHEDPWVESSDGDRAHAESNGTGLSKWEHRVIYSTQGAFAALCLAPYAWMMRRTQQ